MTAWNDRILIGTLKTGDVLELTVTGDQITSQKPLIHLDRRIRDVRVGLDGQSLWVLTDGLAADLMMYRWGRLEPPLGVVLNLFACVRAAIKPGHPALIEPMREDCEDLTEVRIAGGHMLMLERPAEVNRAISNWLSDKGIGPRSGALAGSQETRVLNYRESC